MCIQAPLWATPATSLLPEFPEAAISMQAPFSGAIAKSVCIGMLLRYSLTLVSYDSLH